MPITPLGAFAARINADILYAVNFMPLEKIIEICSGCGACAQACSQAAIDIRENADGFLRPHIDPARCTDCGVCEKICPLITQVPFDEQQFAAPKVYAAYNLDEPIRMQSSSGGIFDLLARSVLKDGGVVFGAAFEEDFSVSQKGVGSEELLNSLRYSKYVQSHTKTTFTEVKEHLKSGRKVLYVGTPCMIGGLISFLGRRDSNLITCSFICGSVSSRKVWRLYKSFREEQSDGELKSVCFRDKRQGWMFPSVVMKFSRGRAYVSAKDWFLFGFYNKQFVNPACLKCGYRGTKQLADLMLADFWGIEEIRPELVEDQKGISLVLVNTGRGAALFDRCKARMYYEEAPLDLVVRRNGGLTHSAVSHKNREALLNDLDRVPMRKIIKKYRTTKNLFERASGKVGRMLANLLKPRMSR